MREARRRGLVDRRLAQRIGVAIEYRPTGRQLVEQGAHRIQVDSRGHRSPLQLFRRHIAQRSGDDAIRSRRLHQQPEVEHDQMAVVSHEQVRRLEVAMDHPLAMQVGQRTEELWQQVRQATFLRRTPRAHIGALDRLHREEVT